MEPREIKGLEIAAKLKLVRKGNTWYVPSQSNKPEKYTVALTDEKPQCTCRDYEFRNDKCKQIFAVEYTIEREHTAEGQTVVTETVKVIRKTYPQNWPAYNAAQTHEKSELQALLMNLRKQNKPRRRRNRSPRSKWLLPRHLYQTSAQNCRINRSALNVCCAPNSRN